MANPTATLTWDGLEAYLTRLYDMPANVIWRQEESRRRGKPTISSADAAKAKVKEIRDSSVGVPEPEEFVEPKRFLRAAGPGTGSTAANRGSMRSNCCTSSTSSPASSLSRNESTRRATRCARFWGSRWNGIRSTNSGRLIFPRARGSLAWSAKSTASRIARNQNKGMRPTGC